MTFYAKKNGEAVTVYQTDLPADESIEISESDFNRVMSRDNFEALDISDNQLVFIPARTSPAHDWINGEWVLNEEKQQAIDIENEVIKRTAFQAELDARMDAAVAIASPLDYANKRKTLPADKAARLNKFNTYIDDLAALEYSDEVVWPTAPE